MEPTPDNPAQGEPAEYGLEVLCANWNPLAATLAQPVEASPEIVTQQATVDVEGFLASFYRSQQG
jgi:hypothetical protein